MDTNMTAHSMCCRLRRDAAQVRHAREQARAAVSRWGLREHADLAELIVSELATNAIRHGHGMVRVCVSYACGHLRVDVHDDAAGRPARRQATPDDESGRGLALLDGLIELHGGRRGFAADTTGHGKTVYVLIRLGPGPAPRRVTCQHAPPCPAADAPDRAAARMIAFRPEQGWSLLCNGIVVFDDTGALLADGTAVEPHRAASPSPGTGLMPNEAPRGATCRSRRRRQNMLSHRCATVWPTSEARCPKSSPVSTRLWPTPYSTPRTTP
jgi:anti-sigma regulatory factor (Ser/Thr protein kinase)